MKYKLLFVAVLPTFIGCSGGDTGTPQGIEMRTEISSLISINENKWRDQGLVDYMFTYSRVPGDCPTADPFPPVVITVEDGEIVSAFATELNIEVGIEGLKTIPQLFIEMHMQLAGEHIAYQATRNDVSLPKFNEAFGYPENWYVDRSGADCDATAYAIFEFQ